MRLPLTCSLGVLRLAKESYDRYSVVLEACRTITCEAVSTMIRSPRLRIRLTFRIYTTRGETHVEKTCRSLQILIAVSGCLSPPTALLSRYPFSPAPARFSGYRDRILQHSRAQGASCPFKFHNSLSLSADFNPWVKPCEGQV